MSGRFLRTHEADCHTAIWTSIHGLSRLMERHVRVRFLYRKEAKIAFATDSDGRFAAFLSRIGGPLNSPARYVAAG